MAPSTVPLPTPEEAGAILGTFRTNKELFSTLLEQVEREWDNLCREVDAMLRRGEHAVNSDSAWSSFTGWIADINPFQEALVEILEDIRKAFEEVRKAVDKLFPMIRLVVERSAPVLSLCEHSLSYLSQVFGPLGDLYTSSGSLVPDAVYWGGPTKEHYVQSVVADQKNALDRVTDHVEGVSTWLAQTAAKNTDYMVTIVHNLSPIPNALTAAAANVAVATVDFVSAFWAIDNLAQTLGNTVQAVLDQTADLFGFLVNAVAGIQELTVIKTDRRDLAGGKWPQSVVG
ncbi:hypothetical protein C6361_11600 [Plantactinospora sp. BC1]|uniref:hypothetical protein n=1 Tax=Plantactinospora sp. BC1 TaxID=2108470 RepID=UPI000D1562E1|nr:hypothetical protein [Plantactinospora sp. BC1]AVT30033.1 hypothetical protein C6361_11600 [Plantactinospora sp. BC1]